jgi:hypothetical protein
VPVVHPKINRAKTRIAFGVHGEFIHVDNVRAFAATPNPDWPSIRAKLRDGHAPAPVPPVVGPDHYKNAQALKKRAAEQPAAGKPPAEHGGAGGTDPSKAGGNKR